MAARHVDSQLLSIKYDLEVGVSQVLPWKEQNTDYSSGHVSPNRQEIIHIGELYLFNFIFVIRAPISYLISMISYTNVFLKYGNKNPS